jgi:ribosomal protein L35
MKTNKSFTKRIKVTRTGKTLARKPGQDHFNAKESGTKHGARRRSVPFAFTNKQQRRFLP